MRDFFPEDAWKNEMETARIAARRVVTKGLAEILQKGKRVDLSIAKRAIRVSLKKK